MTINRYKKYHRIFLILLEINRTTGNFEEYFKNNTQEFYLYIFPASFEEKPSRLIYYKNGDLIFEKSFFIYNGKNKFLKLIFYYLYYAYCILFIVPGKTWIITYQVLFCLGNGFFSLLKNNQLVLVVGDYFHIRNGLFVAVYHMLMKFYNRRLDYILYPTKRLQNTYGHERKNVHYTDFLSYGIKNISFKKNPQENYLGYIGNLRTGQGIELLFACIKKNTKFKLDIIGSGNKYGDYKLLAKKMKIKDRVTFYGFVESESEIIKIISRWQIAVALYEPTRDNPNYYGEPSKIKLYLQFHLPIITTNISSIADELVKEKAGIVADYNITSVESAITSIKKNYSVYLIGINKLIKKYEFNRYYNKIFDFLK